MNHVHRSRKNHGYRRVGSWVVAALGLLAAACGGGDDDGGGAESIAGSGGRSPAGAGGTAGRPGDAQPDCDSRPTQTVTVDRAFWHSGFKVTLGDAVLMPATADCAAGELRIGAEFFNRAGEAYSFDPRMLVASAGNDYEPSFNQDIPHVPGGRTGRGTLGFSVDSRFALEEATLIVGGAGQHHAVVPIGAASPDPHITLQPENIPAIGEFEVGAVTFHIEEAFVRADLPSDHDTYPKDQLSMQFNFSVTYKGGTGGVNLSEEHFLLDLPDGTSVAPSGASIKYLGVAGATTADLFVRFTISHPVEGAYALLARGNWAIEPSEVDWVEGQFPFEVPPLTTYGE